MNHTQTFKLHVRGVQASSITTNLGELPNIRKLEFVGEITSLFELQSKVTKHIWLSSLSPVDVSVTDSATNEAIASVKGVRLYVSEFSEMVDISIKPSETNSVPILNVQTLSRAMNLVPVVPDI